MNRTLLAIAFLAAASFLQARGLADDSVNAGTSSSPGTPSTDPAEDFGIPPSIQAEDPSDGSALAYNVHLMSQAGFVSGVYLFHGEASGTSGFAMGDFEAVFGETQLIGVWGAIELGDLSLWWAMAAGDSTGLETWGWASADLLLGQAQTIVAADEVDGGPGEASFLVFGQAILGDSPPDDSTNVPNGSELELEVPDSSGSDLGQ